MPEGQSQQVAMWLPTYEHSKMCNNVLWRMMERKMIHTFNHTAIRLYKSAPQSIPADEDALRVPDAT